MKKKTITELRTTLFETFDEVVDGEIQYITHKNGSEIAMMSVEALEKLKDEIEVHKNLAIGYAQALRGEGISSSELTEHLKQRTKDHNKKHA